MSPLRPFDDWTRSAARRSPKGQPREPTVRKSHYDLLHTAQIWNERAPRHGLHTHSLPGDEGEWSAGKRDLEQKAKRPSSLPGTLPELYKTPAQPIFRACSLRPLGHPYGNRNSKTD
jgi:hypothetical protein